MNTDGFPYHILVTYLNHEHHRQLYPFMDLRGVRAILRDKAVGFDTHAVPDSLIESLSCPDKNVFSDAIVKSVLVTLDKKRLGIGDPLGVRHFMSDYSIARWSSFSIR